MALPAGTPASLILVVDEPLAAAAALEASLEQAGASSTAWLVDWGGSAAWSSEAERLCKQAAAVQRVGPFRLLERLTALGSAPQAVLVSLLGDLPGRAHLLTRMQALLQQQSGFGLLCADLDRFSTINNGLGHAAGDELLTQWVERTRSLLHASDVIARLSGDRFALLLLDAHSTEAVQEVVSRLRTALEQPFRLGGTQVYVSMSIGLALAAGAQVPLGTSPEVAALATQLLSGADLALHRARSLGPGQTIWYAPEMHEQAVTRLELETDLRQAIRRGDQLDLYFQPIVGLSDLQVSGFEALVRWHHPRRGLLKPAEFISLAEEAGLIVEVGEFVIERAYDQLLQWDEACDRSAPARQRPYVAINLSSQQFRDLPHIQRLVDRAESSKIRDRVQFEITESILMDNAEQVVALLNRIQASGSSISIDDFGTGYSSLSYLHRFPVDILKIDRAFVSLIGHDTANLGILRAIVRLGHDLGLKVVAEGIETRRQCEVLQTLGCEFGQGFYFSHPVSGADSLALLESVRG